MKRFRKIAAQGDGLIMLVDSLPANVKPSQPVNGVFVVLHSESGHVHTVDRSKAEFYESADDAFIAFIKTGGEGAELKHERSFDTHESIMLEPNKVYEVRRQREYIAEGFRKAQD